MFPFLTMPPPPNSSPLLTQVQNQATPLFTQPFEQQISENVTPSKAGIEIDEKALGRREGNEFQFYVPQKNNQVIKNSGVTIGKGFDLGQLDENRLNQVLTRIEDVSMRDQLRAQFLPFVGRKREEAVNVLSQQKTAGNMSIDIRALPALNKAVIEQYKDDVADRYFKDTGFNLNLLNPNQKQVLFEINYHTLDPQKSATSPNAKAFKNIATALANGETGQAIAAIKKHPQYDSFKGRYNQYIKLLRK